jgi:hypothetical protein
MPRLVVAFVSVEAFVHRHKGHQHDHDGAGDICSMCAQIAIARHVLNSLACVALALTGFFAGCMKKPAKDQSFCFSPPLTLIFLKVQFNT